jgi:hypothetical protein
MELEKEELTRNE